MKKTWKIDIDCPNCAAKVERALQKLPGADNVAVNYVQKKITLEAADDRFEEVRKAAYAKMKEIEPDAEIFFDEAEQPSGTVCPCGGHHHEDDDEDEHEHHQHHPPKSSALTRHMARTARLLRRLHRNRQFGAVKRLVLYLPKRRQHCLMEAFRHFARVLFQQLLHLLVRHVSTSLSSVSIRFLACISRVLTVPSGMSSICAISGTRQPSR